MEHVMVATITVTCGLKKWQESWEEILKFTGIVHV